MGDFIPRQPYIYLPRQGILWGVCDCALPLSALAQCKEVLPMSQREIFIDNLLARIHFIIEMIWWTGLAPWDFPGSLPPGLCLAPKLTDLYHGPSVST